MTLMYCIVFQNPQNVSAFSYFANQISYFNLVLHNKLLSDTKWTRLMELYCIYFDTEKSYAHFFCCLSPPSPPPSPIVVFSFQSKMVKAWQTQKYFKIVFLSFQRDVTKFFKLDSYQMFISFCLFPTKILDRVEPKRTTVSCPASDPMKWDSCQYWISEWRRLPWLT